MRFVIDESSFEFQGMSQKAVLDALDILLDLIERAHEELHQVYYAVDLSEYKVLPEHTIFELFDLNAPIHIPRELNERLMSVMFSLPRLEDLNFNMVADYDVLFDCQSKILAPTIAWVHAYNRINTNEIFSCLSFNAGRKNGCVRICVLGNAQSLWFVGCDSTYQSYFRSLIIEFSADDTKLKQLHLSAFDNLRFGPTAIDGMKSLKGQYRDLIGAVVRHLSVLSDHGIEIFNNDWGEAQVRLRAEGVIATEENGNTKANKNAWRARSIEYNGEEIVCSWHTKLSPNKNRIYFSLAHLKSFPPFIIIGKIHAHL